MPGPEPKDARLRQRRNRSPSKALLSEDGSKMLPPDLPTAPGEMPWHARTRAWWAKIWRSPMAGQWMESDIDGLMRLALLVDKFWWHGGTAGLAAEIRQQEARYGLSPLDRRRLEWRLDEAPPVKPVPAQQADSAVAVAPAVDPRFAARKEAAGGN